MPRSIDPFQYTNWETAPVLRNLQNDVHAHVEDAMHGNRANKVIIEPATVELATSCIEALQELGMAVEDVLDVVSRVFAEETTPAHA